MSTSPPACCTTRPWRSRTRPICSSRTGRYCSSTRTASPAIPTGKSWKSCAPAPPHHRPRPRSSRARQNSLSALQGGEGGAHRVSDGRVRWALTASALESPPPPPPPPPPPGGGGGGGGPACPFFSTHTTTPPRAWVPPAPAPRG